MLDFTPTPVYEKTITPVVPICQNWKAEVDGIAGECKSPLFADAVFSKWDALSPVMTVQGFACMYWEGKE